MNTVTILCMFLQTGGGIQTASPYAVLTAPSTYTKQPSLLASGLAGGSFLGGSDDCNSPHVFLGTGPVAGVPFTTGTTGTEGQNEANCYAFGTTGVTLDVWFDWQASMAGEATMTTCGGTGVDTKIAVYPLNDATCPADGTSLDCNDDACGLQSSARWPVVAATTYTLQLGTFPGASGGNGVFDITIDLPPTCGQYDEANGPSALGLTAGGEIGWLHYFDCMQTVHTVATMYGEPALPGLNPNGGHSWILVYEDASCDVDATTDLTLRAAVDTVVVNADIEIFNPHPIGPVSVPECFWIAATADSAPGEFPAPMAFPPTPAAWVVGSTLGPGTLNIQDLNANNVPPLQMNQIGLPACWFLRAEGLTGPGSAFCFGDGSGTPCPCGNVSASGAGCGNGSFPDGAMLLGSGTTLPDTVTLVVSGATPSQPGLFFQGEQALNGGAGFAFGDGLRCAGRNVVRLQVAFADSGGFATSTVPLSTTGGALPGDTRFYQYWYRDPVLSPCGSGFNLTNGYEIAW